MNPAALDAVEVLLMRLGLDTVYKAAPKNPLTPKGFDAYVLGALRSIRRSVGERAEQSFLDMSRSLERNWPRMSPAQREAAIDNAARQYLNLGRELAPRVSNSLKEPGKVTAAQTRAANAKEYDLRIDTSLSLTDQRSVWNLATSQANFVRDTFGVRSERFSQKARTIVADGLAAGHDRYEISAALAAQLNTNEMNRTNAYWQVIASVFTGRARSMSTLQSFDAAGIKAYEFEAVLDEVTSQTCRFMHGRRFRVAPALERIFQVEQAENPEAVKQLQPWPTVATGPGGQQALVVDQGGQRKVIATVERSAAGQKDDTGEFRSRMSTRQMEESGICTPPLHGHCRSLLVPVF